MHEVLVNPLPRKSVVRFTGHPDMTIDRGDQIFFSATCPGQVACKNPLVLRNFLLVPKYFSNRKSIGQVANTTISLALNQSCR